MHPRGKKKRITAAALMAAEPTMSGVLSKQSNRLCAGLCRPKWQQRLFVLAGTFLFRFKGENSSAMKGVPIPCESVTLDVVTDLDGSDFGYEFKIRTLRKTYTVRSETAEERAEWIRAIRAETKLAVKLRLGHASLNPQHKDAYAAGVGGWEKRLSKDAAEAESGTEMAMVSGGAMATPGGSVLGMA